MNFNLRKSLGTIDTPADVKDTDELAKIIFEGFFGNTWHPAASIVSVVEGTPSGTVVPASLEFRTSNTATPVTRMTIDADGNVNFEGSANINWKLTVAQYLKITSLAAPPDTFTTLLIDDDGVLFTDPGQTPSNFALGKFQERIEVLEMENKELKTELAALRVMIEKLMN